MTKLIIKIKHLLLIACCLLLFPFSAKAAILYFLPQSQSIYEGESFIVNVRLDTEGKNINAIEGHLNFSPQNLEILEITKGGSVLTLWPEEPSFANESGKINFVGGVPLGFEGQGELFSIVFLTKTGLALPQTTSIVFEERSRVLLSDGKGTSSELSFSGGNYEIVEKPKDLPQISSKSHPDQNKWNSSKTLQLHWELKNETEYSYLLTHDPLEQVDEISDRPEGKLTWLGDMEYKNLDDGIYYFLLRQKLPGEDWSGKISFRAMIDSVPPEPFELKIGKDPSMFEGRNFLSFAAADKTSGIDYYEISETKGKDQEILKKAKSPYALEDQSLQSVIKVKAVDKAGNEQMAEIIPLEKPIALWKVIVALAGLGIILWFIKRYSKFRKHEK